jgi:hypothetical protein
MKQMKTRILNLKKLKTQVPIEYLTLIRITTPITNTCIYLCYVAKLNLNVLLQGFNYFMNLWVC